MSDDDQRLKAQRAALELHDPVLLSEVLQAAAAVEKPPAEMIALDGTFGAGGYSRALLEAGVGRVVGVDQDPQAIARAREWADLYGGALDLVQGRFGELDEIAHDRAPNGLDFIALDIGVSSMQIDAADRGFSFMRDGPLDMRMRSDGESAADLVNGASEEELADILYHYGEERAARRIARAIVAARKEDHITTTARLAEICASCAPRPKPGQPHPATRSFQALRIAVNDELGQLVKGLAAAERALTEGGVLAVVTFHSLEDRIVKRFFQERAGKGSGGSRYAPQVEASPASFTALFKGAQAPSEAEIERNPRSRSAKLRAARRAQGAASPVDAAALGAPQWNKNAAKSRRGAAARRRAR